MRHPPRWKVLIAALVLGWAALAASAAAQVTITFLGHEGKRIRNGFLYFPHAYVQFSGTLEATGEPVDEAIGFIARDAGPQLLFMSGRGQLSEPDAVYEHEAIRYLSLTISDETYQALRDEIERWRGVRYHLRSRNCIHFAAAMARITGLNLPSTETLSPNGFLQALVDLNSPPADQGPQTPPVAD